MIFQRLQTWTYLAILVAGFSGCPAPSAPPRGDLDKFKSYYARWIVLRELAVLAPYDSVMFGEKSDSLRKVYGLSGNDVRRMLDYFQDSLPRWEEFLSGIRDTIDLRQKDLTGADAR